MSDNTVPTCDVCNTQMEEADEWCGSCGCCVQHCQKFEGCPPDYGSTSTLVFTLNQMDNGRWKASLDDPYDWFGTPIAEAEGGSKDAAVQNLLKEVTLDD